LSSTTAETCSTSSSQKLPETASESTKEDIASSNAELTVSESTVSAPAAGLENNDCDSDDGSEIDEFKPYVFRCFRKMADFYIIKMPIRLNSSASHLSVCGFIPSQNRGSTYNIVAVMVIVVGVMGDKEKRPCGLQSRLSRKR
jgi:hypothetical protein